MDLVSRLTLGHGSGGRLSGDLATRIARIFASGGPPQEMEDCALLPEGWGVTLDGFTVTPRTFPGGNLGKLAVCGAVNDLAVRCVRPRYLCLGVIAEEGFDEEELMGHMGSAAEICAALELRLVAGDTKVVPKGAVDGLFLTTCAWGIPLRSEAPGMTRLRPGDHLLVTGAPGRHGAAIAASRYDLAAPGLESDCAPLVSLLEPLHDLPTLRCMRDCTRGGLGTALGEWAEGGQVGLEIRETDLPRSPEAEDVARLLGLDPLYLACEGTAVVAVGPEDASEALGRLRRSPLGSRSAEIGVVTEAHPRWVGLSTAAGGMRVVDLPVGELLPRIC